MPVNLVVMTDGELREALLHMAQAIITQAHDITAQATREGAPGRIHMLAPLACRLRDFTRMNYLVYFGS